MRAAWVMRAVKWIGVVGVPALCLLCVLARPSVPRVSRSEALFGAAAPVARPAHSGPLEAALREARGWHGRAMLAAARSHEALAAWDPEAHRIRVVAEWQQEMARDREGYLRRAREATRHAVRLARTQDEIGRVAAWQARLACDTGDHPTELRYARRLMALEPQSERSLLWLRRAARCNGLKEVEQQADRKLMTIGR